MARGGVQTTSVSLLPPYGAQQQPLIKPWIFFDPLRGPWTDTDHVASTGVRSLKLARRQVMGVRAGWRQG